MGATLPGPATTADPPDDRAHGIARHERRRVSGRQVLRVLLYLPRRIIDLAVEPIRLGLWAYERYELRRLYQRVFSFDGQRFGLYPVVKIESAFGASAGARIVHHDLFRNRGSLDAWATYGNRSGAQAGLDAHTGWLGKRRWRIGLASFYRDVPADRFYGIGDGDLEPAPAPPMRVDARARTMAVQTRFEHERVRIRRAVGRHRAAGKVNCGRENGDRPDGVHPVAALLIAHVVRACLATCSDNGMINAN